MQVEPSAKVHLSGEREECSPVPLIHVASMTKSTSPFSFGGFILNRKSSCSLRALLAVWVWSKLAEFWHSATKATKALSLLLDSDVWLVLKASWCKTGTMFINCRELQTFTTTKNVWFTYFIYPCWLSCRPPLRLPGGLSSIPFLRRWLANRKVRSLKHFLSKQLFTVVSRS